MIKIAVFCILAWFAFPSHLLAQYSNASFSGPWILVNAPHFLYMVYDGHGLIEELGNAQDSVHPCGSYSVDISGNFSGTLHFINGVRTISGNFLSDSTTTGYQDSIYGPFPSYRVSDTGALAGNWTGYIYDSSSLETRYMQFTVNNGGIVTSANGVQLTTGKIYTVNGYAAGYFTTTDSNCRFNHLQLKTMKTGDTLAGPVALGKSNLQGMCYGSGYAFFTKVATGISSINPDFNFSVFPQPFSEYLEITVAPPCNKIQLDLFDIDGRELFSGAYNTQNIHLDNLGSLSKGIYFLRCTVDSKSMIKKIVKTK